METEITATEGTKELFVKMAISAWETHNSRVTKLLDSLTDEQLLTETAPGRNRGIYLVGHMATISDGMFALMNWGERQFPQYDAIFVKNSDKPDMTISVSEVRNCWAKVYTKVAEQIGIMKADDWFRRHTAVSEEDFAKEPHRNKLNLLINRTNHISYHLGQLMYLVKK